MIEEIRKQLEKTPHIYSDEELKGLGIDPNLFLFLSRPDFSDNAFALWEYIDRNTDYKTAWLLLDYKHSAKLTEKGIINAVWDTPEGQALARSARFFVYTLNASYVHKYPGQIFINVWHGAGVKATGYLSFKGDHIAFLNIGRIVECTDLFLIHSIQDKANMSAEYCYDARKFIATGQPRMDRVKTANGKRNIERILGGILSKYERLVLYAPTWRMSAAITVGEFIISNLFSLPGYRRDVLENLLKAHNAAMVIKLHPTEMNNDLQLCDGCYLIEDEDLFTADVQMNDILNAFDVMIADYSSLVTDFLLLDKPIIYTVGDIDEYSQKQGFVHNDVDFYMPGDKVTTFDGLLAALTDAFETPNRHSKWRQLINRQKCSFLDDNACKRALEAIENFKPLTNYVEKYFLENTLVPYAERYEQELEKRDTRIEDYESRISLALQILGKSGGSADAEALKQALETPTISEAERKTEKAKAALEKMVADVIDKYAGDHVFLSLPQELNYSDKTRTKIQQIAAQIAKYGYLFLLGVIEEPLALESKNFSNEPSMRTIEENFFALDFCAHIETVLNCIKVSGKKCLLVVPSDFIYPSAKIVEKTASLAEKIVYFYCYPIKDYLGMETYSLVDIARFEALNFSCRDSNTIFIACTESLLRAAEDLGATQPRLLTAGVEARKFKQANGSIPKSLLDIKKTGRPVIGYCGSIDDHRLYFSIIHYICGKYPNYEFVFIGKDRFAKNVTIGHVFTDYPNIHLLEEADYHDIPAIIHSFDVAIIPYFKLASDHVPSKLFEYLACGKPVVTTEMPYCQNHESVYVAKSHGEFAECLERALKSKGDLRFLVSGEKTAEANDWKDKALEVLRWCGL